MRIRLLTFGLLCVALGACTKGSEEKKTEAAPAAAARVEPPKETPRPALGPAQPEPGPWQKKALEGQELWASMRTNEGTIVIRLFSKDAPLTVANFVGLATGEQAWEDPKTGERTKRPLYEGSIFHRVIDGFMIQGGDPLSTGRGDPGYRFKDEFQSGRGFDKPGLLAMANAGPGTNGSQFFITVSTPTHLNNRHTIFGEVVKGYDVVQKIATAPINHQDRPFQNKVIEKVTISDKQP